MGMNASKNALLIILVFALLNSSSSDPSRTMRISPTVPSTGSRELRSGILTFIMMVTCFTHQPSKSSRITEGILEMDELISNRYARMRRTQRKMISEVSMAFNKAETMKMFTGSKV